ncbi:MAG: Hsp20/alpha crystallin family protein [bacterium]
MMSLFKKTVEKKNKTEEDWFKQEGQLAIDVYETDAEIVVRSTIAGVKTEDLDIFIENNMLTIRGSRENLNENSEDFSFKRYLYQECYWGKFSRQAILPEEVNNAEAKASMKDGILTIIIPKLQKEKRKTIAIEKEGE